MYLLVLQVEALFERELRRAMDRNGLEACRCIRRIAPAASHNRTLDRLLADINYDQKSTCDTDDLTIFVKAISLPTPHPQSFGATLTQCRG